MGKKRNNKRFVTEYDIIELTDYHIIWYLSVGYPMKEDICIWLNTNFRKTTSYDCYELYNIISDRTG